MFSTAEVRWFFDGRVPSRVYDWFVAATRATDLPETRIDRYLLLPGTNSIGLKLRQQRFEIKLRSHQYGSVKFNENVIGRVERWRKWSFGIGQNGDAVQEILNKDLGWLDVHKNRHLQRYVVERKTKVRPALLGEEILSGCEVELTGLEAGGRRWWTFAFESFGEEFILLHNLVHSSEGILTNGPNILLKEDYSYGYPQWIQAVLG